MADDTSRKVEMDGGDRVPPGEDDDGNSSHRAVVNDDDDSDAGI